MLYSDYSKKKEKLEEVPAQLSNIQILLLNHLHSVSWYERLISVLPANWEEAYDVKFYSSPYDVYMHFGEEIRNRDAWTVYQRKIVNILTSKDKTAVPRKYEEYYKRDDDFPKEANQWTLGREEATYPDFHVNHRLIWISAEHGIDFFSNEDIKDIPYKYTIHVYNPDNEVLTDVQQLRNAANN